MGAAKVTEGDLARSAHANIVGSFASLTRHLSDGETRDIGGVTIVVTGSPIPIFNEVLPVAHDVAPDSLAEAIEIVRRRGVPFLAQLRFGVDDHLVETAEGLGLVEDEQESTPCMVLDQLPTEAVAVAGLEISRCEDDEGFDRHASAIGDMAFVNTFMNRAIVRDPSYALWVGCLDGVPVATSIAYYTAGVVGIYNVGTRPDVRRRGVGWAMTSVALASGVARGCEVAVLQGSGMGAPLYAAHGFRTIFRYRAFAEARA